MHRHRDVMPLPDLPQTPAYDVLSDTRKTLVNRLCDINQPSRFRKLKPEDRLYQDWLRTNRERFAQRLMQEGDAVLLREMQISTRSTPRER
jgi:hypothetical protein